MSRTSRTALRLVAIPAVVTTVMAVAPNLTGIANAAPPVGSVVNPSDNAGAGPGTVVSSKANGTDSNYRYVVRASDPDNTGIASVQIQVKDCGAGSTFQSIGNATQVGTTDTWQLLWNLANYSPAANVANCPTGAVRALVTDNQGETSFVPVAAGGQPANFQDATAETVRITSPANGGSLGFFSTGTTNAAYVAGTASAGATDVNLYVSDSAVGTAPDWVACGAASTGGSFTANTDGTHSWTASCDLTGTGITAANVTEIGAKAVGGTADSGDAVRVTGYAQTLQTFSITPPTDTQSVGFANTYTVQVRDQNGAPIVGAPIQAQVQGTSTATPNPQNGQIKFAINDKIEGTASDPFTVPPAGFTGTAEPSALADSNNEPDGAPDDVDGTNGSNNEARLSAVGANDIVAIAGVTQANGNFRFSLALPNTTAGNAAAGNYNIKAFLDADGSGTQGPNEAGDTATKTYQVAAATTLTASPPSATNVVGETHTIKATLKDQNGNPISGKVVTFRVTNGPNSNNDLDNNNTTPTGVIGQCTTGSDGTCTKSYTSSVTGTDTIAVWLDTNNNFTPDTGELQATPVTKTWVNTTNASCIDLEPKTGNNPSTASHVITATVTNGAPVKDSNTCSGTPMSGVPVDFTINPGGPAAALSPDTNGNTQTERVFTDANGVAQVTLKDTATGNAAVGTDTVTANIAGTPAYTVGTSSFQDISGLPTATTVNFNDQDEGVTPSMPLPFALTYDGHTETGITMSSNGAFNFTGQNADYSDITTYPTGLPGEAPIGAYWADLDNGVVHTATLGAAPNRVFVVQYNGTYYGSATSVVFETKFFEGSNNIEVDYQNAPGFYDDAPTSVGVENLTATSGTQVFFDNSNPSTLNLSGKSVTFTPAAESARRTESVAKTWYLAGVPSVITCSPSSARNIQGTQHTITCNVTDGGKNPVSGVAVSSQVTSGPNSSSDLDSNPATPPGFIGTKNTDASGNVSFTYTGIAAASTTPDTITTWVDNNPGAGDTTGVHNADETVQTTSLKYWTIAANLSNAKIAIDMSPTGTGANDTAVGTPNTVKCDAALDPTHFGHGPSSSPASNWDSTVTGTVGNVEAVCVSVLGVDNNIQYGESITLTSSGTGVITNNDGTATGTTSQTAPIDPNTGYAEFYILSKTSTGTQTLTASAANVNATATGTKSWASFPARNVAIANVGGNTATPGQTHQVKVTVTDRNGNPVPNQWVRVTESGPGHFLNGPSTEPSSIDVQTGTDGTVTVELTSNSNEAGTETVTAALITGLNGTLLSANPNSECNQAAGTPTGAPAGNCSAQVTVTWQGTQPPPAVAKSLPAYRAGSRNNFRDALTSGPANSSFGFGNSGDIPLWGDWNGDGTPSIGVFRPSTRTFYLANNNNTAVAIQVTIGNAGDLPAVGDFNGDGTTSIALFRPSTGTWYITNDDHSVASHFVYGQKGDRPLTGDWTKQGVSRVGVYRPSTGVFYRIGHAGFRFGNLGDTPVVGDWDGNGTTTVGVVRGTTWYVSNNNSTAATSFSYGVTGARFFTWSSKVSPAAPGSA